MPIGPCSVLTSAISSLVAITRPSRALPPTILSLVILAICCPSSSSCYVSLLDVINVCIAVVWWRFRACTPQKPLLLCSLVTLQIASVPCSSLKYPWMEGRVTEIYAGPAVSIRSFAALFAYSGVSKRLEHSNTWLIVWRSFLRGQILDAGGGLFETLITYASATNGLNS